MSNCRIQHAGSEPTYSNEMVFTNFGSHPIRKILEIDSTKIKELRVFCICRRWRRARNDKTTGPSILTHYYPTWKVSHLPVQNWWNKISATAELPHLSNNSKILDYSYTRILDAYNFTRSCVRQPSDPNWPIRDALANQRTSAQLHDLFCASLSDQPDIWPKSHPHKTRTATTH